MTSDPPNSIIEWLDHPDKSGNAFPVTREEYTVLGLSKREYFAALAMQGLLSGAFRESTAWNLDELPQEAVNCADALLAALQKNPTP